MKSRFPAFALMIAALSFLYAGFTAWRLHEIETGGIRVEGRVLGCDELNHLARKPAAPGARFTGSAPVTRCSGYAVEFTPRGKSKPVTFIENDNFLGISKERWAKDDKVSVLYFSHSPEKSAMVEKKSAWDYVLGGIVLGVVFGVIGLPLLFRKQED